jgi:adenylate cyclase
MDALSSIFTWLSDHEAGISAVVGLIVISTLVAAGVRRLLRRPAGPMHSEGVPSTSEPARAHSFASGPPPMITNRPSIVVLPFTPVSDEMEHKLLADGMTEDITVLLARVPGFFVIAHNSSLTYKGKSPDVREVGRDLGVRYVLEGSVRKVGERIRVTVELIETEMGAHLWTEKYDRPLEEIDALQDELAGAIVAQLEPELTRAEVTLTRRRPPENLDAWAFYRKAQSVLMFSGWREQTFAEVADLLRKSIALDPEFALAHAQLALVLALGHMVGVLKDREAASTEALEAVEQATTLDPTGSEVQGLAGCALADLGHLERAIAMLERAIERNPSNAQAWVALGSSLLRAGQLDLGVEKLAYGMRISPRDSRLAIWGSFFSVGLLLMGRYEEALEQARLACKRDDKLYVPRISLALVLAKMGDPEEARAAFAEARRLRPELSLAEVEGFLGEELVDSLRAANVE